MTDSAKEPLDGEPPKGLYLLHDSGLSPEQVEELQQYALFELVPWPQRERPEVGARVLVYLSDERIRDLANLAIERNWELGVLPHEGAQHAMAALGVRGRRVDIFQHYLTSSLIEADVLFCNDEAVFSSVVIGQVLALRPGDINRPQKSWNVFTGALRGLGKLRLKSYTLITGKAKKVSIAALGMVALAQTQSKLLDRAFSDELGIADGRISLLALAPRSITGYLYFLLRLLWPGRFHLGQLPNSLSLLQTDQLHISAPEGTEYLLDGKPVYASELELAVKPRCLQVLAGPSLNLRKVEKKNTDKETVRLNHIPEGDIAASMVGVPLPMFSHASEEEYRDLFIALRDAARPSSSFQVLMVLSVLLALTGLYANSAPVIIGAMILAPLMAPIVSLAMGLARTDASLIRSSMHTLGIGLAWGFAWAILVAWAMPLEVPTTEMKARMSPTLLDLLIAVVSGVAGAYANAKDEIAKSLAGVAIAVALVPPLSVAGIGLGWGDWHMAWGAFLLLITNLVGIALAASATFLVLGFAPFHRARAGMGVTLMIMLVIAAPLSLSFSHLVTKDKLRREVPRVLEVDQLSVQLSQVRVNLTDPPLVRAVLSAHEPLTISQIDALKTQISQVVGRKIELEVEPRIRR
ncbi:MAG: TIGR00341 family protein [Pseudomonadota bacterium]